MPSPKGICLEDILEEQEADKESVLDGSDSSFEDYLLVIIHRSNPYVKDIVNNNFFATGNT